MVNYENLELFSEKQSSGSGERHSHIWVTTISGSRNQFSGPWLGPLNSLHNKRQFWERNEMLLIITVCQQMYTSIFLRKLLFMVVPVMTVILKWDRKNNRIEYTLLKVIT